MDLHLSQVTAPLLRTYDAVLAIDRAGRSVDVIDAGPTPAVIRNPGDGAYLIRQARVILETGSPAEIERIRRMLREAKGLPVDGWE